MESAIVPPIYDPLLADENLSIRTEDAYRMARELARSEAMLVSPSSAAALVGCVQVAGSLPPQEPAVIVTIFPDAAEKYLNERFWDEN
jgi:cysteine synthase B